MGVPLSPIHSIWRERKLHPLTNRHVVEFAAYVWPPLLLPIQHLNIELALALPQPARGVRIAPILLLVHIMITNGLLGFLTAIFVLIWRFPVILNPTWFPKWASQGSLDESVSLLQLAEAFAKRLERERAQIAERINDPETIRDVSPSLICFPGGSQSRSSYSQLRV